MSHECGDEKLFNALGMDLDEAVGRLGGHWSHGEMMIYSPVMRRELRVRYARHGRSNRYEFWITLLCNQEVRDGRLVHEPDPFLVLGVDLISISRELVGFTKSSTRDVLIFGMCPAVLSAYVSPTEDRIDFSLITEAKTFVKVR